MHLIKSVAMATMLAGIFSARSESYVDGHFSSWEEVPGIIASITEAEYDRQLEQLHELTRIKLGDPQSSLSLGEREHRLHLRQTKENWNKWWNSTGEPVSVLKKQGAEVDAQAFEMAWEFLGVKQDRPDPILPVWIPETWSLYVTFSNGDYGGREKELWIIDRTSESASLSKLRGDHSQGGWGVVLSEIDGFSPKEADRLLKAICYLHRYAPEVKAEVTADRLERLYYPHSTLHLKDGANRVLWNTEGYEFTKSRPEYRDGESGRTYYFLRTKYPNGERWKRVTNPTSGQLLPYRRFLSFRKPYFCSSAADVIQLFGEHGGSLEKQAMLEWAEKQKAATNPQMDWEACAGDFQTGLKVNVINFTRMEIQNTLQQVKMLGDRLEADGGAGVDEFDADRTMEGELDRYVSEMLALEKREDEEAILAYPQPLRDLIIADEHPDDSDLKHLSAAVQAIRNAPDPKLFSQLVIEMHEGTLKIRSLLNYILLNEHNLLELKPWGKREEAVAVEACIASLPQAEDDARDNLVEIILRVCGGGKIEMVGKNGGRRIEVIPRKDGYSAIYGGSSSPLPMEQAQNELRRLYRKSRGGE